VQVDVPQTQYARSGDASIAYWTLGEGRSIWSTCRRSSPASSVASQAGAGDVLVSSTVRNLGAGSGIGFSERGFAELKGIPGEWRLFAVER
jgi:hypothetical protein